MAGTLTYPPEVIIESNVDLPAEFGQGQSGGIDFELTTLLVEIVIEFLFSL
jgi:hypothetical protein